MRLSLQSEDVADRAGFDKLAFVVTPGSERGSGRPDASPGEEPGALFDGETVARFAIDYSTFRDAYGADWAGRLQVMEFNPCVLESARPENCPPPKPIDVFDNDLEAGVITFEVDLQSASKRVGATADSSNGLRGFASLSSTGGPGYGLSAGAFSATGNYAATDLNPSGSWTVGRQAGDFNYSVPIDVPEAPNGFGPSVELSYSSGRIDGLTSDQNTQGGLLGPGWSSGEMFIERRFKSCFRDGGGTGDLCWVDDNAIISMAGVTGELVFESNGSSGSSSWDMKNYRVSNAPGVVIRRYERNNLASNRGNYLVDNNREYFVVVQPDGTEYWFGYGGRKGSLNPGTELQSVWTVPVRGLTAGEPCYNLSSKWCHQAYRWNLDRIVSATGQQINYKYTAEQNHYGRMGYPTYTEPYVSGGRIDYIDYGYTAVSASSSTKTHQINFVYQERCDTLNSACTRPSRSASGDEYPDIPTDMLCGSTTYCTKYSPTFFNQMFMTRVDSNVRTSSGMTRSSSSYIRVDWLDVDGDEGPDPARLWLSSVDRYGYQYGGSNFLANIWFGGPQRGAMDNRVDYDYSAGVTRMKYWRVGRVRDETGALIEVHYTQPRRCPQNPNNDSAFDGWRYNTWSCYARWWVPPSGSPGFSVWHKWVVDKVTVHDLTGVSPAVVTNYDYPIGNNPGVAVSFENGGMAWRADKNRFAENNEKSWGEYRGFFEVRESVGTGSNTSTTVYRYHRGMHGDKLSHTSSSAGTKSVVFNDTQGVARTDFDRFYGLLVEDAVVAYPSASTSNASDISGTLYHYKTVLSLGSDPKATWVMVLREHRRSSGTYSVVAYSYDSQDRLSQMTEWGATNSSYANTVDVHGGVDHRCTKFDYTQPTSRFPQGLLARERLFSYSRCDGGLQSDVAYFYDGASGGLGAATGQSPVRGRTTSTVRSTGGGVVNDNHQAVDTITESFLYEATGYAASPGFSRLTRATDPRGKRTDYSYTSHANNAPITGGGVHTLKRLEVTNAAGHVSTRLFDRFGNDYRNTDANGRSTDACYDRHGRLTHVFGPLDAKPSGDHFDGNCSDSAASQTYHYLADSVSPSGPAASLDLNIRRWTTRERSKFAPGQFQETWTILDGLARPVQTRTQSPGPGSVVTRTDFDDAGRAIRSSDPFYTSGASLNTLYYNIADSSIPTDNRTFFDTYGRVASNRVYDNGTMLRRQNLSYSGNSVTTSAWYNGTNPYRATRTTFDAFGRSAFVVEDVGGANATTEYRYTKRGELRWISTPGTGNVSFMSFNYLGMRLRLDDNEAGNIATTYYQTGQAAKEVDAAGDTTYVKLDVLGRTRAVYRGVGTYQQSAVADNRLATYTYDSYNGLTNYGATIASWSFQPAGTTAYRHLVHTVDGAGRPTRTSTKLYDDPFDTGDDALSDPIYQDFTYTTSGSVETHTLPGDSDWTLATPETLTYTYGSVAGEFGKLKSVSGNAAYVVDKTYDNRGRPDLTYLGSEGARGARINLGFRSDDGALSSIYANTTNDGELSGSVSTHNIGYDSAGLITSIRQNPSGTAGDEKECFYYDSRQRLTRGLTLANVDGGCPSAPTNSTTPGGPAAYNDHFAYDIRDRMTNNDGRTLSYAADVTDLPCVSDTDHPKPKAVSAVSAGGGLPAESFWYDCNGSMMSRVSSGVSTSYSWDEFNRLESTSTGTPVTWTNQVGVSVDAATGDLVAGEQPGTGYTAGASSVETLDGEGAVSFRVREAPTPRILVGLNDTDVDTVYRELDYSIYVHPNGYVYIYEDGTRVNRPGTNWWFQQAEETDIYTIQRDGDRVLYQRNGTTFYESQNPASGSYVVDSSFYHTGTAIGDVTLTTNGDGTTRNLYDADGNRVLREDPDGTTTLYVGATELRYTPGEPVIDAARTYPEGVRRGFDGAITYMVGDHQGSVQATVRASDAAVTHTRYLPYGGVRDGTLVDERGFLNQPHDPSGLVYLNARFHDPTLAGFISVDALTTTTGDPYVYGATNPLMYSDPDGLEPCPRSGCTLDEHGRNPGRGGAPPLVRRVQSDGATANTPLTPAPAVAKGRNDDVCATTGCFDSGIPNVSAANWTVIKDLQASTMEPLGVEISADECHFFMCDLIVVVSGPANATLSSGFIRTYPHDQVEAFSVAPTQLQGVFIRRVSIDQYESWTDVYSGRAQPPTGPRKDLDYWNWNTVITVEPQMGGADSGMLPNGLPNNRVVHVTIAYNNGAEAVGWRGYESLADPDALAPIGGGLTIVN